MKNIRTKRYTQQTHVKQPPGAGKHAPKFVEYEVSTTEQAAEVRKIAEAYAKKHGLKVTVTDIRVGGSEMETGAEHGK
jgi:hypothetical protein